MQVTNFFNRNEYQLIILVVANQYKKDRKLFEKTARHWANVYANGPTPEPECDAAVNSLVEMGFDAVCKSRLSISFLNFLRICFVFQEKARAALSSVLWNTSDALESLCKG